MTSQTSPSLFDPASTRPSADALSGPSEDTELRPGAALMSLLRGLARRYRLIALIVALALLAGFMVPRLMTPVYQGVATILIEANRSRIVSIEEVYAGFGPSREHQQTQLQYMRSREVGLRVVREMDLVNNPTFASAVAHASDTKMPDEARRSVKPASVASKAVTLDTTPDSVKTDPREEAALGQFMKSLEIEPIRQSQLALIRYDSVDPVLAAQIANKTAEAYIAAEMDMRLQMTLRANDWLAGRLAELKQKLDASERSLMEYREQTNLVERTATGGNAGGALQQIEGVAQRLVEARARRAQAEQLYNQVKPGVQGRENASAVVNSSGVARARESLATAQAKFNGARGRFGSGHPAYREAEQDVNLARDELNRQIDSVFGSLAKDYQLAVATETQLQRDLEQLRRQAQGESRKEAQLSTLEQDVTTNRQLYQTFLSRMKETATAADVQTPVARLVDQAAAPLAPVRPRKMLILGMAGLMGLTVAVALALFLNQTDDVVRSVDTLEPEFGLPVIAALPPIAQAWLPRRGQIVLRDPSSAYSEMVRMAAASVQFSTLDSSIKSVAITSAVAHEGKSTVAANLAHAMSRTARVLLIDADRRRSNVHRLLGLPASAPGLEQVLRDEVPVREALQPVRGSSLTVLASGPANDRAFALMSVARLRRLLEKLEDDFDVILIDAPPLEVISDAMVVCRACSVTLVVARSGISRRGLIRKALRRLRRVNAHPFGLIVNGHDFGEARRYYGEMSGYSDYADYRYPEEPDDDASAIGVTPSGVRSAGASAAAGTTATGKGPSSAPRRESGNAILPGPRGRPEAVGPGPESRAGGSLSGATAQQPGIPASGTTAQQQSGGLATGATAQQQSGGSATGATAQQQPGGPGGSRQGNPRQPASSAPARSDFDMGRRTSLQRAHGHVPIERGADGARPAGAADVSGASGPAAPTVPRGQRRNA